MDELPEGISRVQDPGGRQAVRLETASGTVLVSLLGAQVLSWHRGRDDVLWTASRAEHVEGKPVRGGVPIVFPWFGDHADQPRLPAHGFVRNMPWRLTGARRGPEVDLEVRDDDGTRAMWPHAFRLRLTVALGEDLRLELEVANTGETPFACEEALHTYFAVGDVHTASVHGLENVPCIEHAAAPEPAWDRAAPLHFRAETDRVFQDVPARLELRAPALGRTIGLSARSARSAIVWNPWPDKTARLSQMAADDWQRFVCVESGNVKQNRLHLDPGRSHKLSLTLACRSRS